MPAPPRERLPESTLALLADPYRWISRRAAAHGEPAFTARLLGEETLCVTGPDAAEMFYGGRLTRQGAMPKPMLKVLQDQGSVTTLDGARHHVRKALLLSLMTPPRLADAVRRFSLELDAAVDRWAAAGEIVFDAAIAEVITRSTCAWMGVPLDTGEAALRARDLQSMFDGAGAVSPRFARAKLGRARTERWMRGVVHDARSGRIDAEPGTALHAITTHEDERGQGLDDEIAMTELVNVVRPTVAVGRYLTFAVLALHAHPGVREQLALAAPRPTVVPTERSSRGVDAVGDPGWRFVQEVRRTAPFFPLMAGRAIDAFTWHGFDVPKGRRILLDLYGTSRDPAAWDHPERFDPSRFERWTGNPYTLIPQGAGDHAVDHRCAGEWLTIALMRSGVSGLVHRLAYEIPPQDLRVSMRRIPARPASGLVLREVRRREGVAQVA